MQFNSESSNSFIKVNTQIFNVKRFIINGLQRRINVIFSAQFEENDVGRHYPLNILTEINHVQKTQTVIIFSILYGLN